MFQARGYSEHTSLLASFLKMFIMLNYLFLMYYIFSVLYCLMKRCVCSQFRKHRECCNGLAEDSTPATVSNSYGTSGSKSPSHTGEIRQSVVSADSPHTSSETAQCSPQSNRARCTLACQSTAESFSAALSRSSSGFVPVSCLRPPRVMRPRYERDVECQEPPTLREPRASICQCKNMLHSVFISPWADRVRARIHEWMAVPRALLNCAAPNEDNPRHYERPRRYVSEHPRNIRFCTPSESYASSCERQRERSRSERKRCGIPAECRQARRDCSRRRSCSRPRDCYQPISARDSQRHRSKSRCPSISSVDKIRVEFKVRKHSKRTPKCRPPQKLDCRPIRRSLKH